MAGMQAFDTATWLGLPFGTGPVFPYASREKVARSDRTREGESLEDVERRSNTAFWRGDMTSTSGRYSGDVE